MATKAQAVAIENVPQRAPDVAEAEAAVTYVDFGREICGDFAAASEREWLVTNGIGGFACGTVCGALTRRYHGLLLAALTPPVGRTLLVAKLDETAEYAGHTFPLYANRWASGPVDAPACDSLERFRLEGTIPVWSFAPADALLEKRVWMEQGANTTYVRYSLRRGRASIRLTLRALVNYRDYHSVTRAGDWRMRVEPFGSGVCVMAFEGATPFYLQCQAAQARVEHAWYRDFDLPQERARGLEDREDHLHAATFEAVLEPGATVTVVLSTDPRASLDAESAWQRRQSRERALLAEWRATHPPAAFAPAWIRQLVLAADQFVVARPLADDPQAVSVIAGYPWFADWGRDTMVALPGLTLATGRRDMARKLLRNFARYADRGMLPNNFPDRDAKPDYNTVDAALWFFEAVRQSTNTGDPLEDEGLLRDLFPVLSEMIDWHLRGTRYNIHANADGLLYAGESGVQLTWMDAKVGDWVVTPRTGKPVEVNALWYNALMTMLGFARRLGKPTASYEFLAKQVERSFQRFWNASANCLFDVIDGPAGDDASMRPNQVFAVSLPHSPLEAPQQKAVVNAVAQELLTSYGLRSLAPGAIEFHGAYRGSPRERDGAYHQGTVWSWLLGPFALAHYRVYNDAAQALSFLEPMAHHVSHAGLGSISEICDGGAPFTPRGCFAQAWSVAEVLRSWQALYVRNANCLKEGDHLPTTVGKIEAAKVL